MCVLVGVVLVSCVARIFTYFSGIYCQIQAYANISAERFEVFMNSILPLLICSDFCCCWLGCVAVHFMIFYSTGRFIRRVIVMANNASRNSQIAIKLNAHCIFSIYPINSNTKTWPFLWPATFNDRTESTAINGRSGSIQVELFFTRIRLRIYTARIKLPQLESHENHMSITGFIIKCSRIGAGQLFDTLPGCTAHAGNNKDMNAHTW